jgi:hypothetical protein
MDIKEKIGKALEDIDETSKRCPIWIGSTQYLRLDYVQRLLLEILDDGDEEKKEDKKRS